MSDNQSKIKQIYISDLTESTDSSVIILSQGGVPVLEALITESFSRESTFDGVSTVVIQVSDRSAATVPFKEKGLLR
jgi:hypothetical protein